MVVGARGWECENWSTDWLGCFLSCRLTLIDGGESILEEREEAADHIQQHLPDGPALCVGVTTQKKRRYAWAPKRTWILKQEMW
jgi:hypothetical protein